MSDKNLETLWKIPLRNCNVIVCRRRGKCKVVSRIFGADSARCKRTSGALSIQPKILETSVGTYIWSFWSAGPKWPHPGYQRFFLASDLRFVGRFRNRKPRMKSLWHPGKNGPFHLTKLSSPVPLFCILLTRTITKRAVARVGCMQPECTVPLGTWHFRNFMQTGIFVEWKAPLGTVSRKSRLLTGP